MKKLILAIGLSLVMVPILKGQPLTPVKGTRIGLSLPSGFDPAERFSGFISEAMGASIMVTELAAPPTETGKGFTTKELGRQAITLLAQEPASFGDLEGRLFSVSQKAQGRVFKKWIGLFGDTNNSFVVVATFPNAAEKDISGILKRAVTSSRVVAAKSAPDEVLTFGITPSQDLVVSKILGNTMILSRSGGLPVKNLDGPMMVAGASASRGLKVSNRREFALDRLAKTATLAEIKPETPREITIDGMAGIEVVGHGLHKASGKKATIYQVMLFEETDYYLVQGIVAEQDQSSYLQVFKGIAASFKRKNVSPSGQTNQAQPLGSP